MKEQFFRPRECANAGHSAILIHIDHMIVIMHHSLRDYGFSSIISEISFRWGTQQNGYVSLVPPQYCSQVSPGSYANVPLSVLLYSVLVLLACLPCSALYWHNCKSVSSQIHPTIQRKKRNCPCIICAHVLLTSSSVLSMSHLLLSHAVPCVFCPSRSTNSCHTCIPSSHKFWKFWYTMYCL